MPTPKLPWSKSNRSHSSVGGSSNEHSPVPSVNNETAQQRYPSPGGPQQYQQPQHPQGPPGQQIPQGDPQGPYRQQAQPAPSRTASYRHSSNLSLERPPPNASSGPPQPSPHAQNPPPVDGPRRASVQPVLSPPPQYQQQETKKPSFRSRIVAGIVGHKDDDHHQRSSASKNGGLGRRVSVRRSDQQQPQYGGQSPNNNQLQAQQQWAHHRQGSSSNLPTSAEEDESNLDPFLQRDDDNTPQVPPKDLRFQQHPQQYVPTVPNTHQEQYRPPLARVNTEGSYHTQGGVDHYSPEQHPGLQQQPPQQQQQQYQTYSGQSEQQQNPNHYQAFNPQAPSPHPANAQQPAEITLQQQNYYQYQAQQQQQQPQQQQHSPQEDIHYQQRFQSNQPHQGTQEYQHVQPGRPTSQHQQNVPELQHPQGIRQTAPILNQNAQQADSQHQQLRPPSSQQQLTPPSPVLQPPQYHAYEPQQSTQGGESPGQENIVQHSQNNMAPSGTQRNTLRKVNDAGQQAPSRESSLLQPQGPGLGREPPPVSPGPGVPSFGTNVVPATSQGQPYRGGEKGQQGQGSNQSQAPGQSGRSTPPPRDGADMTEDEVVQLYKEHEVLREKYQKVKRYFFEQQSQVHALQNTLANQRLSLSRTSWDDSEYATRFNRLDGLIAQLSFAIRKDWKSIPPWLHIVVNKTAVETGKQEMTAVGRAFISQWLVENIFEKYFHPDLEPGFSTQLKQIHTNIRRYSPMCQSTEDEEALVAKTVNWRLATLEGLTEMLKSPQCTVNREKLIETLNEQLIASLQMFMKELAPPDLTAGVPMIVELAVTVTQHLPLESRDVHIEYFPPGHGLVSDFMKMESGIPALTDPIQEVDDADRASIRSVASDIRDSASMNEQDRPTQQQPPPSAAPAKEVGDKKRGVFGFGGSKKPSTQPSQLGKRESSLGAGGSQQSLQQPPGSSHGPKDEPAPPRVRLAVGVAVQIRGKSILIKAPVYST